MRAIRRYLWRFILLGLGCATLLGITNVWMILRTTGRCYNRIEDLPENEVGLVLGTSPRSYFLTYRIYAAAKLYKAGKVKHLLVSGDNGTDYYNEVAYMKEKLVELGVPEDAVTCDHAGFRTLDSIVRARRIFGVEDVTIVSQRFHNARAIYLADYNGVNAVAFNARPAPWGWRAKAMIRELAARVVAFGEVHFFGCNPKFLGPKEQIVVATK